MFFPKLPHIVPTNSKLLHRGFILGERGNFIAVRLAPDSKMFSFLRLVTRADSRLAEENVS
jgi:hypothetical protein